MKKIFRGYSRKRIILMISLFILAVAVVILICAFTSQNTVTSNMLSRRVSKAIENFAANFFTVNHEAVFWRKTLNLIVRKLAHFTEYMILGIFVCAFVNVLLNKFDCLRAAKYTLIGCTALAITDEFRQWFVPGRTPRLTDILIDMTGAALGIALTTVVYIAIWKMNHPLAELSFRSGSKQV